MIIEILKKLNLSDYEANIYLASLKLGVAKASEIGLKAEVSREHTYYLLSQLKKRGFVSEIIQEGVKHYSATPPKQLLRILKEQAMEQQIQLKKIMSELSAMQETAITIAKIETYEGVKGIRSLAEIMLEKDNSTILCIVPKEVIEKHQFFTAQFTKQRIKKNIKLKGITNKKVKNDFAELREVKTIKKLAKKGAIYILQEAIIQFKIEKEQQIGIYIKDKELSTFYKSIFETLWGAAD